MGNGGLVVGRISLEFLPELHPLEEHCFGFIGHMISKEGNELNDVIDNNFEIISWVNLCVGSHMGGSVVGYNRRNIKSGSWV